MILLTTAGNVAFWEVLKGKVLRYLTTRLVSCRGGPNPTLALSYCLFLVLPLFGCLVFLRARALREDKNPIRVALQALVTVIVPTCSLWPTHYIELASVLRSRINIPFEVIFEDTVNGVIEFRNPSEHLADLLAGGATINAHTICIDVGWKWRIRYFKWWILIKLKSERILGLSGLLHRMPAIDQTSLDLSLRPSVLTSSTLDSMHCFARLPYGATPTLNTGRKVRMEFTAFSPSLRTSSSSQIISAIPFMISKRPRPWPRSAVSVLKQLRAFHGFNIAIDSLCNVSVDYEHALCCLHKTLSGEQEIREAWWKTQGVMAWRREMFLVVLEAALVRRGWIERWAVEVTIN